MAGEELAARYWDLMLRCAAHELRSQQGTRVEAQDAVQEVLARLLHPSVARRFSRQRPLKPWLMRLVRNKSRELMRKERRHRERVCRPEALAVRLRGQPSTPPELVADNDELRSLLAPLSDH